MNAKDISVAVEADEDMLEKLAENPEGSYHLKLVQRDATYTGGGGGVAEFVYKVHEDPNHQPETYWASELRAELFDDFESRLTTPDFSASPQKTIMRTPDGDEIVTRVTMRDVWDDPNEEDEPMEY